MHNDFSRSHSNPPNDPIFLDQSLFDNHLGKLEIQSVWTDKQYCGRCGWFEKLENEKLGRFHFLSKLDFFRYTVPIVKQIFFCKKLADMQVLGVALKTVSTS